MVPSLYYHSQKKFKGIRKWHYLSKWNWMEQNPLGKRWNTPVRKARGVIVYIRIIRNVALESLDRSNIGTTWQLYWVTPSKWHLKFCQFMIQISTTEWQATCRQLLNWMTSDKFNCLIIDNSWWKIKLKIFVSTP